MAVALASSSPQALALARRLGDDVLIWSSRSPPASVSTSSSRSSVLCAISSSSSSRAPCQISPSMGAECVVVGAGVSGLCTAQALATRHGMWDRILVTEARDCVGGNIATRFVGDYLWEEGPNSFQPSDAVLSMAVDSGLRHDLVFGDPDAPRFVLWDGRLRPVPSKPAHLPFFDLMSFPAKIRAAAGALGLRPPPPAHEESVEEFVRRNLGDQVFERLIEPFCSGVYAGDPAVLSMKAAFGKVWRLEQNGGSIIGGTFKAIRERSNNSNPPRDPRLPKPKGQTVASFRKGLIMLPNAIHSMLASRVKLSWKLKCIERSEREGYVLMYDTPDGPMSVWARSVILTVPSYVASNILRPLSSEAADALSKFYYPPVAAVTLSYAEGAVREECLIDGKLQGFGQLHPRSQGIETLGTIYSSSLFPNRAPPGRVLLLNYIGGATNTGIISKSESELVEAVDRDLRKMLIREGAGEPLVLGVRTWPRAIPQFMVGHLDLLDSATSALSNASLHGLFLGGNYVAGVALGRCVEGAYQTALQASQFLANYAVL